MVTKGACLHPASHPGQVLVPSIKHAQAKFLRGIHRGIPNNDASDFEFGFAELAIIFQQLVINVKIPIIARKQDQDALPIAEQIILPSAM